MYSYFLKAKNGQGNAQKPFEFNAPLTGEGFAKHQKIKNPVLVEINGVLSDLGTMLPHNATIDIIEREDPRALQTLRHDTAHILAEATKALFPHVQVTIGPAIENGFYYDFYNPTPFTPEDLVKIENKMREIIKANQPFVREVLSREKAIKFFNDMGENFKVELIESIPESEEIGLYHQGAFADLCRGPHFPKTGDIGSAFKLTKVSAAYWRGDPSKPSLQRIYGIAFPSQKDLDAYLVQMEEAEKRDHRKLGPALGLFHIQEEAPGAIFWHQKGWTLYRTLEHYMRTRLEQDGYFEVKTPQILDRSLWEASGHWEKFKENMFVIPNEPREMVVKPMNCPCHVQIFKQGIKSYKDLPMRMAEFGSCHRNEPTGALHGLLRVRAFTQDDAHIFCTPEQINEETIKFCTLLQSVYKDLGFTDIRIKFSDRPEKRAGSDEVWDLAEKALEEASKSAGIEYELNSGEGAFYGPKLEFVLKDAMGRDWQCGTLQVDFVLPERLGASYIDESGNKQRPVMLHRAVLGCFERFIGILIEHYAGNFPYWLAPVQFVVATVTKDADDYAMAIHEHLKILGVRAELDLRNEKISYKIREHSLQKIPYIIACGKKEVEQETISLRTFGSETTKTMDMEDLAEFIMELEGQGFDLDEDDEDWDMLDAE